MSSLVKCANRIYVGEGKNFPSPQFITHIMYVCSYSIVMCIISIDLAGMETAAVATGVVSPFLEVEQKRQLMKKNFLLFFRV